jgi:hypothetical protein
MIKRTLGLMALTAGWMALLAAGAIAAPAKGGAPVPETELRAV